MRNLIFSFIAVFALMGALLAQRAQEVPSWAPKPDVLPKYTPPHKPHTKLSYVKAKHKGQKQWSELVVDDDHLRTEYIMAPVGAKVGRRFHPDTRTWWVELEGQIRFEIEGQEAVVARKGS